MEPLIGKLYKNFQKRPIKKLIKINKREDEDLKEASLDFNPEEDEEKIINIK